MSLYDEGAWSVEGLSAPARALWGKTDREDPTPWLSLAQHLVDTANVARNLWETWASPALRARVAQLMRVSEDDAELIYVWLAGVHDIGKATKTFQYQLTAHGDAQRGAFAERVQRSGLPLRMENLERSMQRFPHWTASQVLVRTWLDDNEATELVMDQLPYVLDAHHGLPSDPELREEAEAVLEGYEQPWQDVHTELLDHIASLTGVLPVLQRGPDRLNADAQQLLTGLVIMADWIASNQELFPLETVTTPDERLGQGLDFDLTPAWMASGFLADDIDEQMRIRFGWPNNYAARPVQLEVARLCTAPAIPYLTIIEAPTGEGKTEAAFVAAELLAARTGAGGVMVAAPTMATADGLFTRTLEWAEHISGSEAMSSMFLGHSKAFLNTRFDDLKRQRQADIGIDDIGARGSVTASEWLSGRKKGILSNFVVATVDQVLMLALEAKHSMLRHIGLANKVVVVDEVHAYDTYMSEYLARALEWLARYRVPVILLSATLPMAQKRHLVEAYRSELSNGELKPLSDSYPLITAVTEASVVEANVPARPADLHATVRLIADEVDALTSRLTEVLKADGGCVLIICNTVRRAQEAYAALGDAFPGDVELHHAAFIASDRARKEEALRAKLGPDAHRGSGRPHQRIVVATQVAEQSLDIDVDLLVTDVAPIDLIIQRIGRLHRHARPLGDRPVGLREPAVWIRGVESLDGPNIDAGTTHIYDPSVLLTSLALIIDDMVPHGFTRPDDVPSLVQRAYADTPPALPAGWNESWKKAQKASAEAKTSAVTRAQSYRMPRPSGADELCRLFTRQDADIDTPKGEARGLAQVRDADPTVEVIPILVCEEGYAALPQLGLSDTTIPADAEVPGRIAFQLAAATVRLPSWLTRFSKDFDAVVAQLEMQTPPGWLHSAWLKGQLALPLDAETRTCTLGNTQLLYDDDLGLLALGKSESSSAPSSSMPAPTTDRSSDA